MSRLLLEGDEPFGVTLRGDSLSYSESSGTIVAPQALAGNARSYSESSGTIAQVSTDPHLSIQIIG